MELITVEEARRALDVSRSTLWRMIRRGQLSSLRRRGRRLVPVAALKAHGHDRRRGAIPALTLDHPIFRLIGAGHGGGQKPGARDKHALLDR